MPLTLNFIQWLEFMKALILKKGKFSYCWASFFYRKIIKQWEGMEGGFRILNRPVAALQIQKLMYLRSESKELFLSSYKVFCFNLNFKNNGTVFCFRLLLTWKFETINQIFQILILNACKIHQKIIMVCAP